MNAQRRRGRAFAVLDQVLSAGQNFALMVIAGRQLDPVDFGWFAIALTVCWLLFGVNLAMVTEPLLVRSGQVRAGHWPRLIGSAITFTALTSSLLGLGCIVAAFVVPDSLTESLLVVGLVLPILGIFETVRTAALARLHQGVALLMDAAWVLAWLAAVVIVHPDTSAGQLMAWGLTCWVGLIAFALYGRSELAAIRHGLVTTAFRDFSKGLKRLYLFEYLSTGGLAHLFTMGLSGVVGVAAVGGYRAAQAITGPINTVLNTLRLVVVPVFSRAGGRERPVPQRYPVLLSALLFAVVLAFTGVLIVLPDSFGRFLFGPTWASAAPLILAVCLQRAFAAALMGPITALRVGDVAGATVRLRVGAAFGGYAIALLVGIRSGLNPALWALVAISAVETGVAWWIWVRHATVASRAADLLVDVTQVEDRDRAQVVL